MARCRTGLDTGAQGILAEMWVRYCLDEIIYGPIRRKPRSTWRSSMAAQNLYAWLTSTITTWWCRMSAQKLDAWLMKGKVMVPFLLCWMALYLIQAELDHPLWIYVIHLLGTSVIAGVSGLRTLLILRGREVRYQRIKSIWSATGSWSIAMGVSLSASTWIKPGFEILDKSYTKITTEDRIAVFLIMSVPVFLLIATLSIVAGMPHVTTLAEDIRDLRKLSRSHDSR